MPRYYGKPKRKRGVSDAEVTDFAYKLGCVKRGLKNPDSAISAAYSRGQEGSKPRVKRSTY